MDAQSKNGKKAAGRRSKPGIHNGIEPRDKERYFEVEAIVRIQGFGNPEKEMQKYLRSLRTLLELNYNQVELEPVLILP